MIETDGNTSGALGSAVCKSPRWIAERLNEEGVSSPGADWHRTKRRRDGKWLASAIHGDPKRGSGILNNDPYIGRYVWNRRRSRKKLRSGDREYLLRPAEEWISTSHPELCIVSEDLWQKVKARQRERAAHIGARVRRGPSKLQAYATGAYPKYLLSGILQCGLCGSNLIVSAWRARSGGHPPGTEYKNPVPEDHLQELRDEISNLVNAMAQGALRSSPALAYRLTQCEFSLKLSPVLLFTPPSAQWVSLARDRWVRYPVGDAGIRRLQELLATPARVRMSCMLIFGVSGAGKSMLLEKFQRDHAQICERRNGRRMIVSTQLPPVPLLRSLYAEIIRSMNGDVSSGMRMHQLECTAVDMLAHASPRMLLIDEVQHLLSCSAREQRAAQRLRDRSIKRSRHRAENSEILKKVAA